MLTKYRISIKGGYTAFDIDIDIAIFRQYVIYIVSNSKSKK